MAGWGDDPTLDDLRQHLDEGWIAVSVTEAADRDTVTVERDGERKEFASDHIAFHRFVEGLKEELGL